MAISPVNFIVSKLNFKALYKNQNYKTKPMLSDSVSFGSFGSERYFELREKISEYEKMESSFALRNKELLNCRPELYPIMHQLQNEHLDDGTKRLSNMQIYFIADSFCP